MTILVSALEHSANIHLKSLKQYLDDDIKFVGIFDKNLGEPIVDLQNLAIMGFVDVLKKLFFFIKLNNQMVNLAQDTHKILLIDSSGFNLPLAKKIKKKYPDKEIIYYILPQAWAWKKKRIPILENTIDKLASILPFEKNYYSKNANITYMGHPLLDQIKIFKTSINKDIKKIAFMPGSRKGEITKLIPIYKELLKSLPGIEPILIIPKYFTKNEIKNLYGDISTFTITNDTYSTLVDVDFAFICSGTATLEASLIGVPFILTYIAKPLDYFIVKKFVKLKYIGLANIMFEKYNGTTLHPELVQDEVTIKNLLNLYKNYNRENFFNKSQELKNYLQHGSSKNIAKLIME